MKYVAQKLKDSLNRVSETLPQSQSLLKRLSPNRVKCNMWKKMIIFLIFLYRGLYWMGPFNMGPYNMGPFILGSFNMGPFNFGAF